MPREIKFRAWDKSKKKMLYPTWVAFSNRGAWEVLEGSIGGSEVDDADDIVMQYTGLKDKNGTEIYEGDIVEAKDAVERRGDHGICTVEWNQDSCTAGWSLSSIGWHTEELEVIGNIYENKDLLDA